MEQDRQGRWPLGVVIEAFGVDGLSGVVNVHAGITSLVGPNGSGKTRALRTIKNTLEAHVHGRKVRFLAAGRNSPLEHFRASINAPGQRSDDDAAVGHTIYMRQWWNIESITGDLMTLYDRADLKLKVEARLQQLLDRSVQLSWSQNGLIIKFSPTDGGAAYAANSEASGIIHLVGLLTAIHNDQIGALLIDEPEISLHPQHQAFLLEEMEHVAGDPVDPKKKLIILATHSPTILPLRTIGDLPNVAFFNSIRQVPAQVAPDDDILKSKKLAALITRLSGTHRLALFAERVLLVEGPSDEIIAGQLARKLGCRLMARNAQILPVTGKGEFKEVAKLFRLMNKQVAILADLDALADDNELVAYISELPKADTVAAQIGHQKIISLDRILRSDLGAFIERNGDVVDAAAATYADWSGGDSTACSRTRVTLSRLLIDPLSFGSVAGGEAQQLSTRYHALLCALGEMGCFFLRAGAIENYYKDSAAGTAKPNLAAEEASGFDQRTTVDLENAYADVTKAIRYIAPNQTIDEDLLLRPKLSAALGAAFQSMQKDTSNEKLNTIARNTIGADSEVFKLENCSAEHLKIKVDIASKIFMRETFPFEIENTENLNLVVPRVLPGVAK